AARRDFIQNRNPICLAAKSKDCQQHQVLEVAQIRASHSLRSCSNHRPGRQRLIVAYRNYYVVLTPMPTLAQDVVFSFRTLRRNPGYALVTVLTLALGIGANTAIFSVVNSVILKPLAYRSANRLVFISSQFPRLGFDRFWVSVPEYIEFKERNRSFENV